VVERKKIVPLRADSRGGTIRSSRNPQSGIQLNSGVRYKMSPRSLPFTVYPKKTKMLLLFLVSIAFVAGGILMICDGQKMGWLCVGFFGLGIPVFLLQLYPKSSYLTVSEEGIEYCSLFRSHRLRWSDISEFGTYTIRKHGLPGSRMVGFNYSAEYQRASQAREVSKDLVGFEGGLPDTYGFRADELARMLSDYHREWILNKNAEPVCPANGASRFARREIGTSSAACSRR